MAVVTSIYRKYLDLWYDKGDYEVDEADAAALKQIFNRGGFTKGYFYGDPDGELMASKLSKNAGIFIGNIEKDSAGPLALVRPSAEARAYQPAGMSAEERASQFAGLSKGDYIEIRGREISGNLVTYAEKTASGFIEIGDIKAKAYKGDMVYRLTAGTLMAEARKTFENIDFEEGKYLRKEPVAIKVTAEAGKELRAQAFCGLAEAEKSGVKLERSDSG